MAVEYHRYLPPKRQCQLFLEVDRIQGLFDGESLGLACDHVEEDEEGP
jgi:hypothetical protein